MKKYEKIAEWIRDEVDAGTLSLGDKLPPENELMAQFQVSRQTVRTALSLLRKEG
ncbi:MAG TPA: GntR family transcriptional regulator, partial [Candidatus Dorea faecigallinarum]|nr:GntR family transcriptional regulator [Candidatus Dorea faecigallinarum]